MTFQIWTIKCVMCKKEFEQTHPNQRICGEIECKNAAQRARYAKANKKRRPRVSYERVCKCCKTEYIGHRKNGVYCSTKCRNKVNSMRISIAHMKRRIVRYEKGIEKAKKSILDLEAIING